ncbi:mycofactocin-coupled SDR family oxidoreductase [Skermania piniformis]|uniref:Mycofactocin-coupled SDR family oxidoreductase n=1 Tax=Skermania pinensis TaxID=39122 RepID=A0ABX8S9S3_9ACTN|nr:mycofactocin-coupled SDR family oxidoreductase [Skermania piniformis]QXQ14518.1 mycofactocin-coupled SDR family oxidoreductase [Skermania piniformis]
MTELAGRVAFITGAARGQGRNHAVRLARAGADIVAVDVCGPVSADNGYPAPGPADLAETARLVEAEGRAVVTCQADVRDSAVLAAAVAAGMERFGRLDVVLANAAICNWNRFWEMPDEQWQTLVDTNLGGVFKTLKATVPAVIAGGRGGSVIVISSVAGLKSLPGQAHYSAAKHGLVGLTKSAAIELGEYGIRVNSIHPYAVDTPMGTDPASLVMLERHPRYLGSFGAILTDQPMATLDDISDLVLYLAGDGSRTMTGAQLSIDMGASKV